MSGTTAARTRADIDRQRRRDANYGERDSGVLLARMTAVVGAQRAVAEREAGARYALRQSLIDLAAAAESQVESMSRR